MSEHPPFFVDSFVDSLPREKQECVVCGAKRKLRRCDRCSKLTCFLHAPPNNHRCGKPSVLKSSRDYASGPLGSVTD